MGHLPQISEAEYEVMKIVWKHAPINTNEITKQLLLTTTWSPKTIQTLIKRLVTKGALTYEKQGRIFVYTPAVKEGEYIGQESSSFLNRFYHGTLTSMVSSYLEQDRLTESEIQQLRALLSSHEKNGEASNE
ncbi:MAG: BlaI/MecI/CopY family transcriptional regulator [Lachnospiraceae bacterium]|jgi:BlaI family penicillinase repressor|nr:BlaI/MecI/CopY family transcriptional regulator [Lachnospiraceae bacterium]